VQSRVAALATQQELRTQHIGLELQHRSSNISM
jgi:hypothetical protein